MTTLVLEKSARTKSAKKVAKPLGVEIDELWQLRENKRAADAAVKAIEAEIELAETALLERLDKEGLDQAKGKLGSLSIGESLNGSVEDMGELIQWMAKTQNYQLVQKRVSDPAYRELLGMGPVPGIKPFTKRKLNLRTIPS